MCSAYVWPRSVQGQGKKFTLFPRCSSLGYDFTYLYKKFIPSSDIRVAMIAFVSESTRLVEHVL